MENYLEEADVLFAGNIDERLPNESVSANERQVFLFSLGYLHTIQRILMGAGVLPVLHNLAMLRCTLHLHLHFTQDRERGMPLR
ncbi:MAG: hypothetical protein ACI906_002111 [Candidatus Latescibacterota bacterium]|jgi:hypothetical protein